MCRGKPSGPGDLSVFAKLIQLIDYYFEVVIIISSNLGTQTSDSSTRKLAKFSSLKTLAKYEFK